MVCAPVKANPLRCMGFLKNFDFVTLRSKLACCCAEAHIFVAFIACCLHVTCGRGCVHWPPD
jgi:hypothetical protein